MEVGSNVSSASEFRDSDLFTWGGERVDAEEDLRKYFDAHVG